LRNIPKGKSTCTHINYKNIKRIFEFGCIRINFEYFPVEKYKLDLYDLRQISSNSDFIIRDKLMEILITNFVEVYSGLEAMLSIVDINEAYPTRSHITKAKS
jgi:hypothetical protein